MCVYIYIYRYINICAYIYIYINIKGFAHCRRPLISGCCLAHLLAVFVGLVVMFDDLTSILESFSSSWMALWRPGALCGGIGIHWGWPWYPRRV